ncbi:DUF5810 domain-containing protein [Halobaculum sp. EA56]|uniref:DUF5810 domain-containing protein n=1 Tax=Halobaculum sp. EA56 TaxID=3421648 RepID=UPI003EB8648D
MGYACPVCETPQRDGEHLANHLAFTAMLHGDDHEAWLDEHVDDWGARTPADLASAVVEFAEEDEYEEVFEDTAGPTEGRPRSERGADATREHGANDHEHSHDHGAPDRPDVAGDAAGGLGGVAGAVTDEAVESVLAEARELTEEMYGSDGDANDGDGGTDSDGEVDGANDSEDGE